ncbi:glucans biosynthesis glucosyltransferase H [Diplogelasinospora grovesii]|uniref:Glucans biosynthesis glucosyltransferase H n=1 Tax=Diplogelasinospora grovesii TaxID=303347 RepID=A0AAN6NE27_9PEZI|nr:glucans biosynthesis glucosyltransferase H [Diplogelasinospora grovesii]
MRAVRSYFAPITPDGEQSEKNVPRQGKGRVKDETATTATRETATASSSRTSGGRVWRSKVKPLSSLPSRTPQQSELQERQQPSAEPPGFLLQPPAPLLQSLPAVPTITASTTPSSTSSGSNIAASAPPPGLSTSNPGSTLSVPNAAHVRQPRSHSRSQSDSASIRSRHSKHHSRSSNPNGKESRSPSFRHSVFPAGDARNYSSEAIADLRNDMMVNWLYEQLLRKQYTTGMDPFEGVVLKKSRGNFTCCPPQMASLPEGCCSLLAMVSRMNVRCAMTVNTPVVRTLLDSISNRRRWTRMEMDYVPLPDGLRVQVLRTMADLPRGQLHHFAAFIEDARILVVWDDEPEKLLARAQNLEQRFMEIIWGSGGEGGEEEDENMNEKAVEVLELDPAQLEEALVREHRPIRLQSACMVAVTMALCLTCVGLGWRALVLETVVDGTFTRIALLAVAPVQIFVSLFFFQALVGNLFQIFGPISAVTSNSKYYSGKAPRRQRRKDGGALPHVTIQMPVYKEGLAAVIRPTVVSLKAAISTYEMQGGTANIFVNDDGMQLMDEEDAAQARRDFYDEHNIGWVGRPAHNPPKPNLEAGRETVFLRRGKFKKASNMNYALHVSNRVEDKLATVQRHARWTSEDEQAAYRGCLAAVLDEDGGRTWAEGNIRVGDYILLIDSDTRVPADCLLDAVSEMERSPDVALLQFASGVMNVGSSYFESGVTWFTNLIYSAITFAVASGDACPFVGHNALLRWAAIQDAASYTDEDGYEKYWSESHVSEDFDMALRLQVAGYSLRYAAYTGDGFKEGVSLTVYDELARWEKYAFGCNELLFHPLRFWPVRGPFTPLFRRFILARRIPLPKKLTICAYIGTYYAIAAAWSLSVANYFVTGWYYGLYDKYYLDSFAIYISIITVFTGLGNVALAVLRYRLGEKSLVGAFFENIKWIPMFTIFLGGISIHVSQAILCHFFEIDMVWGATAKEVERVHFATELVRILKRFKWTFVFCFACTGVMVAAYFFVPVQWRIDKFFSIYPLASIVISHFALPVLLNPALMMFTW